MARPFNIRIVEQLPEDEKQPDPPAQTSVTEDYDVHLDNRLGKELGKGGPISIKAPKYTSIRKGNMTVSYAVIDGSDYYYQIELWRKATIGDEGVLMNLIQAFDTVVPHQSNVYIKQPPRDLDWEVYTVVVKGVAGRIGANIYFEDRLVKKLLELNLWS